MEDLQPKMLALTKGEVCPPTADGGRITQWARNNGNQQQWQFVQVGGENPTPTPTPAPNPGGDYNTPVVWQDFADGDIIRVGDAYYSSASTMHYSPGAPIPRSYNLVDWEYAGHSVPRLDFGSNAYDLRRFDLTTP